MNYRELWNNNKIDLDYNILPATFLPEAIQIFRNTPCKKIENKYSIDATIKYLQDNRYENIVENIIGDEILAIIQIIGSIPRSHLIRNSMTKTPRLSSLVPIFLQTQKEYQPLQFILNQCLIDLMLDSVFCLFYCLFFMIKSLY